MTSQQQKCGLSQSGLTLAWGPVTYSSGRIFSTDLTFHKSLKGSSTLFGDLVTEDTSISPFWLTSAWLVVRDCQCTVLPWIKRSEVCTLVPLLRTATQTDCIIIYRVFPLQFSKVHFLPHKICESTDFYVECRGVFNFKDCHCCRQACSITRSRSWKRLLKGEIANQNNFNANELLARGELYKLQIRMCTNLQLIDQSL